MLSDTRYIANGRSFQLPSPSYTKPDLLHDLRKVDSRQLQGPATLDITRMELQIEFMPNLCNRNEFVDDIDMCQSVNGHL